LNLRSLNIAPRAALCFGLITLLVIALGGFAFVQLGKLRGTQQDIEKNWLASVQTADAIQIALLDARLESIRLLAASNPQERAIAVQRFKT
jgi:methyl-accepting chemotaxis protein